MTLKLLYYLGFLWLTLILNSCSTQGAKDPKRKLALLIANQSYTTGTLAESHWGCQKGRGGLAKIWVHHVYL